MRNQVVAAAAVLILAGSSIAVAQHFRGPEGREGRGFFQRWQPTAEDMEAFGEARIAGMKAGLRLSADQEKTWPAFEQAYRGLAKQRAARIMALREQMRSDDRTDDIVQRMQRRAEFMVQRAQGYKQLADAAVPLYQSLDDAQKRRFNVLVRMLRPRPMMGQPGQMGPRGPGRFNDRGGFERQRFGDAPEPGGIRTGALDDEEADLAQERAEELEFTSLGWLPARLPPQASEPSR